jgi:hypothetical protein
MRVQRLAHGSWRGGHALLVTCVAFTAGCASVERVAAPTPAPPIAAQSVPAPVAVAVPEPAPAAAPSPAEAPAPPSTPAPDAAAKSATAIAKPPAKPATAPTPAPAALATQATKPVPAAPATPAKQAAKTTPATPPGAPTLDLKSLETRLRETKAIGVMTKLTLKNQVDDLLDQFRRFYKGTLKTTLAELRKAYDGLVLKVLALLQDADPPLAKDIALSREAIWSILADPVKFATV